MKMINKYLTSKVELYNAISIALVTVLVILVAEIIYLKAVYQKDYIYEDIQGNNGFSNECIQTEEGLYCKEMIQVNWYTKR